MTQDLFPEVRPPFDELPKELELYVSLNFCSNVLQDVPIPISRSDGPPPILIGKGPGHPRVWMSAPGVLDGRPTYFQIVRDNVSLNPQVQVDANEGVTTVKFQHGIVMCRVETTSPTAAAVTTLDLRPAGLNISGDRDSLKVGTNTMSHNQMIGGQAFLSIG